MMKKHRVRLGLEQLETRFVPSTAYWVGGVSTAWQNLNNWATTSGGTTHPASYPNASTVDVVFDGNSTDTCITGTGTITCGNIKIESADTKYLEITDTLRAYATSNGSYIKGAAILSIQDSSVLVLESGSFLWQAGDMGYTGSTSGFGTGTWYVTGGSTVTCTLINQDQHLGFSLDVGDSPYTETSYAGTFTTNNGGTGASNNIVVEYYTGATPPTITIASGSTMELLGSSTLGSSGGIDATSYDVGSYLTNEGTINIKGSANGKEVREALPILNDGSIEVFHDINLNITNSSNLNKVSGDWAFLQGDVPGGEQTVLDGHNTVTIDGDFEISEGNFTYDDIGQSADSTTTITVNDVATQEVYFDGSSTIVGALTTTHNNQLSTNATVTIDGSCLFELNYKKGGANDYWSTFYSSRDINIDQITTSATFALVNTGGKPNSAFGAAALITCGGTRTGTFNSTSFTGTFTAFTIAYPDTQSVGVTWTP